MEHVIGNWEYILLGFMIAEKIVKLTPPTLTIWGFPIGKYDDLVIDGIKEIIFKIAKKKSL